MATYNLDAADLLTLLSSTVQGTTLGGILSVLDTHGGFSDLNVQTELGPSNTTGAESTQGGFLSSSTQFDLITLPTSTTNPAATYPAPTIGTESNATNFDLLSSGGAIIAAGDQFVSLVDFNTGAHADTLIGGAGHEKLTSGFGSNELIAGSGPNTLQGGFGADTLIGGGASRLIAGSGPNTLMGGTMAGASDTLIGGAGKDLLEVTYGNNRLVAGSGGNTLKGGAGADTLIGTVGSSLVAGTGNQVLHAGALAETLIGGSGDDTMVALASGGKLQVTLGSGSTLFRDLSGASATIQASTGPSHLVLGASGNDSITSGSGAMSILSTQSLANLVSNSSTAVGGKHVLTFSDGQTITVNDVNSDITIHFTTGGGSTTV